MQMGLNMHTSARTNNNLAVASSRPAPGPLLTPCSRRAPTRLSDQFRDRTSGLRELVRFCVVGASGYVVNLSVYAILMGDGLHYLPAAFGSFSLALVNNYSLHRLWTFRTRRGRISDQGLRFLLLSLGNLGANLLLLHWLVSLHVDKVPAEAMAIVLVTPLSFLSAKLWAFARPRAAAV